MNLSYKSVHTTSKHLEEFTVCPELVRKLPEKQQNILNTQHNNYLLLTMG